jgi:hypothetical protein
MNQVEPMQTAVSSIDPPTAAEYAIGFESLRFIMQLEAMKAGSAAALARELDLPVRPLRRFLAGADPTPELWRTLTDHTRRMEGEKPFAPLGILGLAVTAAALPEHLRKEARVRLAHALAGLHADHGIPSPGWLNAVLNLWAD